MLPAPLQYPEHNDFSCGATASLPFTPTPKYDSSHSTSPAKSDEIEGEIIGLYGLGMSYKDISSHLREMSGLEVSSRELASVTDKSYRRLKRLVP